MVFTVCNSSINQFGVLGLLRCRKNERGVGGGVLGLVLGNGCEVARIGNHCSTSGFELLKRGSHDV